MDLYFIQMSNFILQSADRFKDVIKCFCSSLKFLETAREDMTSTGVHNKAAQKLHAFTERMMKHAEYYNSNQLITANFDFLKLVIDNWFSIG